MKRFKKTMKLIGFVLLIVLASVGIGVTGVPPVPVSRKKEDTIEVTTESTDTPAEETKQVQFLKE
ncbi:hypothetical protein [Pedobacter sp. MC2016-24]|uniref:hypothetical protein n=1 Tax=Pedobacter sp. MC2016-24 TaxID=2780090 RepID=UPI00187F3F57|nr:hypothetical protein [Pedobacter sp. MC2016-24]MBE9600005.1 hypothetical protein [Pedobacter sp. MC2016-24]